MKKNIVINKNIIFIIAYEIMVFTSFFDNVNFIKEYSMILNLFAVVLIILMSLQNKFEKKYIFLLFLLGTLVMIVTAITEDLMALKIYVLLCFIKINDFKKFIKIDFSIRSILYVSVLILCYFGVIENNAMYRYENNLPTTVRYSLGFSHPNLLGMISLMLVFEYLYLINFKIKIKNVIPIIILFYIISVQADSRTSTYIFILLLIMLVIKNKTKIFNVSWVQKIIYSIPVFFTIITFLGIYIYNAKSDFLIKLDLNIWSRFHYMNYYINKFGISLFGNNILWDKPLDNIYCYMIVNHGIVFLLFYIVLHMALLKKLFKQRKIGLVIIVVLILFFGFFESGMLLIALNPFFFLINKYNEIEEKNDNVNENILV